MSLDWVPPWPDHLPAAQVATGVPARVRYEDLAQDGRFILPSLAHSVGVVVWERLVEPMDGARNAWKTGVIPILTRLVISGEDAPHQVRVPVEFDGGFGLAHHGDDEAARRIFLNIWTRAHGVIGRIHGPQPPRAGERAPMGRLFAEHTFTKLFAPPAERRITRLAVDGLPPVPEASYAWSPPQDRLRLPDGAAALEPGPRPDELVTVFGLLHTDANQHVNSLVYPRMLEEAAIRRFAALGLPTGVLARRMDVAFRKPFFAGDRARVVLQAWRQDGVAGVSGAIVAEGTTDLGRAHTYARLAFW
jgi:hypothetical protein